MRIVIAFMPALCFTLGCRNSAQPVIVEEPPPTQQELVAAQVPITGTVSTIHSEEGCPFVVITDRTAGPDGTITGPEAPELLIPIALDPQYLKSGTRLRFTYRLSRANQGACTKGVPAILEHIEVLR